MPDDRHGDFFWHAGAGQMPDGGSAEVVKVSCHARLQTVRQAYRKSLRDSSLRWKAYGPVLDGSVPLGNVLDHADNRQDPAFRVFGYCRLQP